MLEERKVEYKYKHHQKKSEDVIDDVMENAQKSGAVSGSDYKPQMQSFAGGGYRLGTNNTPTNFIPSSTKEAKVKITLWKNGFTVDEGGLRDYNDPSNQSFLNSMKQGIIPPELQALGNDVSADLLDSRGTDYIPPPVVLTPFSGSGQKLGSTTSSIPVSSAQTNNKIVEEIKIDESLPVTSIQIRLQDGTRLIGKFNHSHRIKHIRDFINRTKPIKSNYHLCTAFPQKTLVDENQTIADAGLLNSVVVQKLS